MLICQAVLPCAAARVPHARPGMAPTPPPKITRFWKKRFSSRTHPRPNTVPRKPLLPVVPYHSETSSAAARAHHTYSRCQAGPMAPQRPPTQHPCILGHHGSTRPSGLASRHAHLGSMARIASTLLGLNVFAWPSCLCGDEPRPLPKNPKHHPLIVTSRLRIRNTIPSHSRLIPVMQCLRQHRVQLLRR